MTGDEIYKRIYLGDGLYAEFDGYQFKLSASDGYRDTASVYLDPGVTQSFINYAGEVYAAIRKEGTV